MLTTSQNGKCGVKPHALRETTTFQVLKSFVNQDYIILHFLEAPRK